MAGLLLSDGGGGIFGPILDQITGYARDLWGVFVGLIIIAATLGMIVPYYGGRWDADRRQQGDNRRSNQRCGYCALVVVAFVAIPQLAKMITDLKPAAPF